MELTAQHPDWRPVSRSAGYMPDDGASCLPVDECAGASANRPKGPITTHEGPMMEHHQLFFIVLMNTFDEHADAESEDEETYEESFNAENSRKRERGSARRDSRHSRQGSRADKKWN